jgi:GNAT superfamily N-acetyltransferase
MKKAALTALILATTLIQHSIYSTDSKQESMITTTSSDHNFTIRTLHGEEILPYIPAIAQLRITVFHDYPYLYEGDLSYEERYLKMYSLSKNSLFVIAQEGDQVIGAITGVPVAESMEEIRELFQEKDLPTNGVYYLGEIVLFKPYRKKKIGFEMYKEFEKAVQQKGIYHQIALCEIDRPKSDPKRPRDYRSLDQFWAKNGYTKHPDLIAQFSYQEIGDSEETLHPMVFWTKNLSP